MLPSTSETEALLPSQQKQDRPPRSRLQAFLGFRNKFAYKSWLFFFISLTLIVTWRSVTIIQSPMNLQEKLAPGEWYWLRQRRYYVPFVLHLCALIPCAIIFIFQFVPSIRQKYIRIHRINGYIALGLLSFGTVTGVLIAPVTFGGSPGIQLATYTIAAGSVTSAYFGWYNIRRHKINVHREWMLRSTAFMFSIITQRPVSVVTAMTIGFGPRTFYSVWNCDELSFLLQDEAKFEERYPECAFSVHGVAVVPARFTDLDGVGSVLRVGFEVSTWVAILINMIVVEVYINRTREERLKLASDYDPDRPVDSLEPQPGTPSER